MRKYPIVLFAALLAAAAWRVSVLARHLPDIVAVHFDASGQPNGFTTQEDCRQFMLSLTLGAPAFIVLVTALIPRLIPPAMINIPNRAYWLAPERAAESLGFLSEQGIWFGCIFLAFLACVDELLVKANSAAPPVLPTGQFLGLMVLLFAAISIWALRMFRRFRQPG
jgi:serine/threonine-protein kinase